MPELRETQCGEQGLTLVSCETCTLPYCETQKKKIPFLSILTWEIRVLLCYLHFTQVTNPFIIDRRDVLQGWLHENNKKTKLSIYTLFSPHSSQLNGQVQSCQGKYVIWYTYTSWNWLEGKKQYGSLLQSIKCYSFIIIFVVFLCVSYSSSHKILDLGSGFGGPARHLAHTTNCSVTALELQEDIHKEAENLTKRCNLQDRLTHIAGDFLKLDLGEFITICCIVVRLTQRWIQRTYIIWADAKHGKTMNASESWLVMVLLIRRQSD